MTAAVLDYLTATMRVGIDAPDAWLAVPHDAMYQFYENPNDERWASVSRILYHESIHFWQLFSSGYIGNIVGDDWHRLVTFEKTGRILPPSANLKAFATKKEHFPFSAKDLTECWARYWDVHTRGPVTILREEGRDTKNLGEIERISPLTGQYEYSQSAYDAAFLTPGEATEYSEPYRWMMDRTSGHSRFVATVFPVLCHLAFASPKPVEALYESFETAWRSRALRQKVNASVGIVNIDWIELWDDIAVLGFVPVARQRRLPLFTSGADVIKRGSLESHPIYSRYLHRLGIIQQFAEGWVRTNAGDKWCDNIPVEAQCLGEFQMRFAARNFWGIFAQPGQPEYRYLLGVNLAPARIVFRNYEWITPGSSTEKLSRVHKLFTEGFTEETLESQYATILRSLDERVEMFRTAVYAQSRGISVSQFE